MRQTEDIVEIASTYARPRFVRCLFQPRKDECPRDGCAITQSGRELDCEDAPRDCEVTDDALAYIAREQGALEVVRHNALLLVDGVGSEIRVVTEYRLRGIVSSLHLHRLPAFIPKHVDCASSSG